MRSDRGHPRNGPASRAARTRPKRRPSLLALSWGAVWRTMGTSRRTRRRARVQARARIMLDRYGSDAYAIARRRGRRPNRWQAWFWAQVSVELARLEGREIGLGTSDRWQ